MAKDRTPVVVNRSMDLRHALTSIKGAIIAIENNRPDNALQYLKEALPKAQSAADYLSFLNYATTYSEDNWQELFSEALEKQA